MEYLVRYGEISESSDRASSQRDVSCNSYKNYVMSLLKQGDGRAE